jgi:hypothetical protein
VIAAAALALLAQDPRVLTPQDALLRIEGVSGPVQVVGDLDGDGLGDLVVERGERAFRARPASVVAVSLGSGEALRTLWTFDGDPWWWTCRAARSRERWDARGDADGDGVFDLLVGEWRAGDENVERSGMALVVSGATGEVLHRTVGARALDGYGFSVAWLGDVDGDGRDDYAVGAPQARLEEVVYSQSMPVAIITRYREGDPLISLELEDGSIELLADFLRRRLDERSERPGYVSVRSGADGRELARYAGERAGHAFGTRVVDLGDLDGDGRHELGAAPSLESRMEVRVLSVAKDAELARLPNMGGLFGSCGDLDGEGRVELFQITMDPERMKEHMGFDLLSGDGWSARRRMPGADLWSPFTVVRALGDLDGDGAPELAIGEANYGIDSPQRQHDPDQAVDLPGAVTLDELVARKSDPSMGGSCGWESGCAWVMSGWPPKPVLGVYGLPDDREGVGLWVERAPDVDDDGRPDLLVTTHDRVLVFSTKGLGG